MSRLICNARAVAVLDSARPSMTRFFDSAEDAARFISEDRISLGWYDGDHTGSDVDVALVAQNLGGRGPDRTYTIHVMPTREQLLTVICVRLQERIEADAAAHGKFEEAKIKRARAERILASFSGRLTPADLTSAILTRCEMGWHVDVQHRLVDWPSLSTYVPDKEPS